MIFAGCNYTHNNKTIYVVEVNVEKEAATIKTESGKMDVDFSSLEPISLTSEVLALIGAKVDDRYTKIFNLFEGKIYTKKGYVIFLKDIGMPVACLHELQLMYHLNHSKCPTIKISTLKKWFDEKGNCAQPKPWLFFDNGSMIPEVADIVKENWHKFPPNSDIVTLHAASVYASISHSSVEQIYVSTRTFFVI